ncbi:MAG: zinc-ribbon domain-containing protein [Phycisphaerae bacterium]|nr:zinc-ribbon domain-containing protein [Phycisphaerae bacterium]MCZ2400990.1 zinc-ribbon domain-containing protein [Phycisphaerae bacterium]NUQ48867.1 zinc-ribbon domain-containing protein [Phycisphaerae bacterium]
MAKVRCPNCTAQYAVPDVKLGKRARCARCQQSFVLSIEEGDPIPLAADLLAGLGRGETVAAPAPEGDLAEAVPVSLGYAKAERPSDGSAPSLGASLKSYVRALAAAPRMFTRLGNVITFIVVFVLVALQVPAAMAPCFGLIAMLILNGWYMAYLLNVAVGAANGEEDLPDLTLTEGFWEGIVLPLLKFLVVSLVAALPMIAAMAYCTATNLASAEEAFVAALMLMTLKFEALLALNPAVTMVVVPAVVAGQVMLPMLLLTVAVGGIGALVRVDLMLTTIMNTLPAYLVVLLVYGVSAALPPLLQAPLETAEDMELTLRLLVIPIAIMLVEVAASIISMRAIGLYYLHFKQRFAFAWG